MSDFEPIAAVLINRSKKEEYEICRHLVKSMNIAPNARDRLRSTNMQTEMKQAAEPIAKKDANSQKNLKLLMLSAIPLLGYKYLSKDESRHTYDEHRNRRLSMLTATAKGTSDMAMIRTNHMIISDVLFS